MNLQQPMIKRPANPEAPINRFVGINARRAILERRGLGQIPVAEYNDDSSMGDGSAVHIKNRHMPRQPRVVGFGEAVINPPVDEGLDDIYSSAEKRAFKKRADAGAPLQMQMPMAQAVPAYQGFPQTATPPMMAAQPQYAPAAPVPMTAEELDAYNRRARKAAKHPILERAEVCLNCEFFYAYTRGTDTRRLTLCEWNSTSPWNKDFTCGTSKCKDYRPIGSEPPKAAEPPIEKKKRRRRSRAEIDAAKAQESNAVTAPYRPPEPREPSADVTEAEPQDTPAKEEQ